MKSSGFYLSGKRVNRDLTIKWDQSALTAC